MKKIMLALTLLTLPVGCVDERGHMVLWKAQSSGQASSDAANFSQVLRGNSLKPLAPVNLRGYRGSSNNLLIEWTRRARIGIGMRPSTDVPIAEETETYLVEIYSGATLLRSQTMRATALMDQPVQWAIAGLTSATPTQDVFGTLTYSSLTVSGPMRSVQQLTGDFVFSFSADPIGSSIPATVSIRPYGHETEGLPDAVQNIGGSSTLITLDSGDQALASDMTYPIRWFFVRRGTEIRIYQNDPNGTPELILHKQFANVYSIYVDSTPAAQVLYRPRLTTTSLGWLYTSGMQTADFGSPQSAIKVRVHQVSALVGAGGYTEATL